MNFHSDSYHINSMFSYNLQKTFPENNVEIVWDSGLSPTELNTYDEATYSGAYVYQIDDIDYIVQSGESELLKTEYSAPTDWMAIRNKFFVMAIVPEIKADYAVLGSKNISFDNSSDKSFPVYQSAMGFRGNFGSLAFVQYIGPLDVDDISKINESLDLIMNFGWSVIAPFSKAILWFIKLLHNMLNINYGIISTTMGNFKGSIFTRTYEKFYKNSI